MARGPTGHVARKIFLIATEESGDRLGAGLMKVLRQRLGDAVAFEGVGGRAMAREGLTSAEEDYKFSKGRYELGAGTYLDLLTSEVGLAGARQSLVEASADARIAEAGLEFAVGAKRY